MVSSCSACIAVKMHVKFEFVLNFFVSLELVMLTSGHVIDYRQPVETIDIHLRVDSAYGPVISPVETTNAPTTTAPLNSGKDLRNFVIRGMICTCGANSGHVKTRNGYSYTVAIGAHKLHKTGATFGEARKICNDEGAHLAIINSLEEEKVLIDMFKAVKAEDFENVVSTGEARLGLHDLYKDGEWVTILGDSLARTGYNKWGVTGNGVKQPDNAGGEHCAVLMIYEKSLGMNDVQCQLKYPFFCEIPEDKLT